MTTSTPIAYTKSAAARILGVSPKAIKGFRVWAYVCWVHVEGSRPTMVSKKAFCKDFVEFRQGAGFGLWEGGAVSPVGRDTGVVRVQGEAASYRVRLTDRSVVCTCEDYARQVEVLGFGVCKHGYAALNAHGFGSFGAYSEAIATGKKIKSKVGGRSID